MPVSCWPNPLVKRWILSSTCSGLPMIAEPCSMNSSSSQNGDPLCLAAGLSRWAFQNGR